MGLLSRTIRSLINGISQQSPTVRLDNQLEAQENMIPDLALGLTRRNPVTLDNVIAQDGSRVYADEHAMFKMTINEEDVVIGIKPDGTVYRFDEGFEDSTINQDDAITSYLTYTDKNDIVALETNDKLILLNRGVKVTLDLTGYTTQNSLVPLPTDDVDQNTTTFSSTMDASYIVGVSDATNFFGNNASTDSNGKVVIWKDDHTEYQLYEQDADYLTVAQSPSNARIRKCWVTKVTSGDLVDTSLSTWRNSMPDNLLVEVSYDRSVENVRLPPMYNDSFGTRWEFRVGKAAGGAYNYAEIRIGSYSDATILIDGPTFGSWNDTGDTLFDGLSGRSPLSDYTITINGQVYSFEYKDEDASWRTFRMSAVLDKNQPSYVSGLPIKIEEVSQDFGITYDTHNSWYTATEGVSVPNSEEYKFTDGGGTYYAEVTSGSGVDENITSIELSYTGSTGGTELFTEGIPNVLQTELSSYSAYYSDTERLHVGWCVGISGLVASYCVVHQENTNVDSKGLVYINAGSPDDLVTETYNDRSIANARLSVDNSPTDSLNVTRYVRGDLTYSVPVLGGRVDVYNYSTKLIRDADSSRHLIWVKQAFDEATYTITHYNIDGTAGNLVATYTAEIGDTPKIIMTKLIQDLAGFLTYQLGPNGLDLDPEITQENNTIVVRCDDTDYFKVSCDFGDSYIQTIAEARPNNDNVLVDPTLLPEQIATGVADSKTISGSGKANFLVKINTDINNPLGTYYLEYSADHKAWVETTDGYINGLDKTTMPVVIVKGLTSVINVQHSSLALPEVGDNISNKAPSFTNGYIQDLIVFNSRLGYASENTLVFSTINEDFNLFRTTTSSYLISDVVDLTLDSSKLGYRSIQNVFTLDNDVVINTGLSQSILKVPTNLDISKAIFANASSFDLDGRDPVSVRRAMYFPIKQGNYSTIKAFSADLSGVGYTDNSATRHCEKYIAGEVLQTIFSNDVTLIRTDADKKVLYVQHSYVQENTIIQNAWHKWSFAHDIKYMFSSGEDVKIIFEDTGNNQTIYGTLSLVPNDVIGDTTSQIGYTPYLDFSTEDVVLAALIDNYITVDKALGKLVTLGDANSVNGVPYSSNYTLSEIVPRKDDKTQGQTKMGYVNLMLRRMSLGLGLSGRLTITVSRTNRDDYTHNYVPSVIGTIVVGREEVTSESARFPVNGRSQDITVNVDTVDTFTPLQAVNVEWQGQLITKGGR